MKITVVGRRNPVGRLADHHALARREVILSANAIDDDPVPSGDRVPAPAAHAPVSVQNPAGLEAWADIPALHTASSTVAVTDRNAMRSCFIKPESNSTQRDSQTEPVSPARLPVSNTPGGIACARSARRRPRSVPRST